MAYQYPSSGGYAAPPSSGYQYPAQQGSHAMPPTGAPTPSPYYAAAGPPTGHPPPAGPPSGYGYGAPAPGGAYGNVGGYAPAPVAAAAGYTNGYATQPSYQGAPYGHAAPAPSPAVASPAKVADSGMAYTHPAQRRPAMPAPTPSPASTYGNAPAPTTPHAGGGGYPSYPSTFASSSSPYAAPATAAPHGGGYGAMAGGYAAAPVAGGYGHAPPPPAGPSAGGYGGGYGGNDMMSARFPEESPMPDYPDFEGQQIAPPPLPGQHRGPSSMPSSSTGGAYGAYPPMPAPSPSSSTYPSMPAAPPPMPMPISPSAATPNPALSSSSSSSGGGMGGAAPGLDRPFVVPDYVRPVHPKYLSMTVQAWPSSSALRLRSNLSFGLVIRPLATPPSGEAPPPVINFGSIGVVRCTACRAYINPFVQFFEGGAKWRCNLCGRHNQVPPGYFAPLGRDGRRADLADRPELIDAAVEIVAPAEYMVRPPMPPVFVFVIDVSVASIKSGMLPLLCATIRKLLPRLPGDKRTMVGFVTYDSSVHFYSLRAGAEKPQMFVESDLTDIFLPVPDHLLVNLDESRSQVEALLDSLSRMHAKTEDVEAATGPALDAALKLMGRLGGKLLLFTSGLPSIGDGRLGNRENPRLLNTDKEQTMLVPASDFYKQLAIKLTRYQIGVDVFLFSDVYTDVASLNDLAHHTGGQSLYYPGFMAAVSANRFKRELTRCLTRLQGWESVVRIRSSKGSVLQNFYGNFYLRGADLLALPCIDCDKAYAVEMKNDETVMTTNSLSVQSALLYTTSSGERRIRVHNVCIPVSSALHELYQATNVNAMTNLLAKQAVDMALAQTLAKARDALRVKCVSIMRTYRSTIATGTKAGPDYTLSTLPLMTLGLIKSTCLKEGNDVRVDTRASAMAALATMGIVEFETYVRPRMVPIHEMKDSQGFKDEKGSVELPPEVPLSAEQLKPDSVFLIDNGFNFFIRIGRAVSPWMMSEAFGVASFDELDPRNARLRRAEADDNKSVSRRLANIITYLRSISPYYQEVVIVKEGDAAEIRFINQLIEDRNMSAMSLAEFNNHILRGSGPNATAY